MAHGPCVDATARSLSRLRQLITDHAGTHAIAAFARPAVGSVGRRGRCAVLVACRPLRAPAYYSEHGWPQRMASKKRASDVPLDQLDEKNTMRNEGDDPRASEDDGRWRIPY